MTSQSPFTERLSTDQSTSPYKGRLTGDQSSIRRPSACARLAHARATSARLPRLAETARRACGYRRRSEVPAECPRWVVMP